MDFYVGQWVKLNTLGVYRQGCDWPLQNTDCGQIYGGKGLD
jgi:hypothetical protein